MKRIKEIAADLLKCGKKRIHISLTNKEMEAIISRNSIRHEIVKGTIKKKQLVGISRGRARKTAEQKRKGRQRGTGSQKRFDRFEA